MRRKVAVREERVWCEEEGCSGKRVWCGEEECSRRVWCEEEGCSVRRECGVSRKGTVRGERV